MIAARVSGKTPGERSRSFGRFRRLTGPLYAQVLVGMAVGIAIGILAPSLGVQLKPVADAFIKLVKMLLVPVIFGTIVVGIAQMGSLKSVGRLGLKALVYFEIVSTFALAIGLLVANLIQPGAGMDIDPATLDTSALPGVTAAPVGEAGIGGFLLQIIPDTFGSAFTGGNMLQVILAAVLFGVALSGMPVEERSIVQFVDRVTTVFFRIVGMVMRLAPFGAGAGIAFTISKFGLGTLSSLAMLLVSLYLTTLLFIFAVLGAITRVAGLPFLPFLRFIKDEILVVLGTCSTEAVLPQVMDKMKRLGVAPPAAGMVLPAGYTFNADGTCIYLAMAAVFIAQATNTELGVAQQALLFGVLLLTSKGSAGVAGAGFVTLAATVSSIPSLPLPALVLLLGVDRFLNEARAVTNLIGNAVATVAVARWDGALDLERARAVLRGDAGEGVDAA